MYNIVSVTNKLLFFVVYNVFCHGESCLHYMLSLTLQRRSTFKFLPSPQTEEFKFPTSTAPSSIHGIDL